jgi:hypothetical protein
MFSFLPPWASQLAVEHVSRGRRAAAGRQASWPAGSDLCVAPRETATGIFLRDPPLSAHPDVAPPPRPGPGPGEVPERGQWSGAGASRSGHVAGGGGPAWPGGEGQRGRTGRPVGGGRPVGRPVGGGSPVGRADQLAGGDQLAGLTSWRGETSWQTSWRGNGSSLYIALGYIYVCIYPPSRHISRPVRQLTSWPGETSWRGSGSSSLYVALGDIYIHTQPPTHPHMGILYIYTTYIPTCIYIYDDGDHGCTIPDLHTIYPPSRHISRPVRQLTSWPG